MVHRHRVHQPLKADAAGHPHRYSSATPANLLPFEIVHCDGGEFMPEYGAANLLEDDPRCYCSHRREDVTVVLRIKGDGPFTLAAVEVSAPKWGYTSPLGQGIVFASFDPPNVAALQPFSGVACRADYEALLSGSARVAPSSSHMEEDMGLQPATRPGWLDPPGRLRGSPFSPPAEHLGHFHGQGGAAAPAAPGSPMLPPSWLRLPPLHTPHSARPEADASDGPMPGSPPPLAARPAARTSYEASPVGRAGRLAAALARGRALVEEREAAAAAAAERAAGAPLRGATTLATTAGPRSVAVSLPPGWRQALGLEAGPRGAPQPGPAGGAGAAGLPGWRPRRVEWATAGAAAGVQPLPPALAEEGREDEAWGGWARGGHGRSPSGASRGASQQQQQQQQEGPSPLPPPAAPPPEAGPGCAAPGPWTPPSPGSSRGSSLGGSDATCSVGSSGRGGGGGAGLPASAPTPVLFFELGPCTNSCDPEVSLCRAIFTAPVPCSGRYVTLKLLRSSYRYAENIDVEYIGLWGWTAPPAFAAPAALA